MTKLLGLLTVLLIFNACTSSHPITQVSDLPSYDGPAISRSIRHNLTSLAWHEWRQFGGQIIEHHGQPSEPREENRLRLIQEGHHAENDSPLRERIRRFWFAVDDHPQPRDLSQTAWSAAFIAWLMKMAGVPSDEFHFSSAHARYLMWLDQYAQKTPNAQLKPHNLMDYQGKVGDLLCATRGTSSVTKLADLYNGVTSHCDLIVEQTPQYFLLIGGNVFNSVSLNIVPRLPSGQPVASRPWFAWIENRYD